MHIFELLQYKKIVDANSISVGVNESKSTTGVGVNESKSTTGVGVNGSKSMADVGVNDSLPDSKSMADVGVNDSLPDSKSMTGVGVNDSLPDSKSMISVGVHVRRSDFLWENSKRMGIVTAGKDYIVKAMKFMKKKLENEKKSIKFLMLGDDFLWNRENFENEKEFDVVFLKPNENPAIDLCILSICDHIIMTTGTFGWWAAYFNKGTKVYSKFQVRPNSPLANAAEPFEEFFPPDWIGL